MKSPVLFALVGGSLAVALVGCGDFSGEPAGAGGSGTAAGSGNAAGSGSVIPGGAANGGGSGGSVSGGSGGSVSGGSGGSGGREVPPEASCENVQACGGDVAGVWFASSSCLPVTGKADLSKLGVGCMEAEAAGKLDVTGNLTLGADGMMSDNTSTTGEVVMELAAACLDVSGTVTQCDRIASPLASAGFDDITCVDSTKTTGGCTCTGKVKQMGSLGWLAFSPPQMGTYATESNVLKLSTSEGTRDYAYCVEGNFMKVTPSTPTVLGQVAGTVVFRKQP